MSRAASVFWGMKWWAKENGSPSCAASRALKSLEPSNQIAGAWPAPGTAVMWGKVPAKYASSSASCSGRPTHPPTTRGEVRGAAKCVGRDLVGAWGAPDTEVYSSRMQSLEHSELFCDHQRLVVGKHDSAGT